MHDDVKQELLFEHREDPKKQDFIELVSTPAHEFLPLVSENKCRFIKSHFPFSLLPPSITYNQSKVSITQYTQYIYICI